MNRNILQAHKLSCERDERILFSGLSFSLSDSELVQIEGPNGAGKTTLLRILAGLYSYYEGEVTWNEESVVNDLSSYHQSLFFMSHKTSVKPLLTARENLLYLCGIAGLAPSLECIDEALCGMGMRGYEDVDCFEMSAGQQRRVALASLLLTDASILMLDEPFTALDRAGVKGLESVLSEKARRGALVIFTSHHQVAAEGVRSLVLSGATSNGVF
jgi:heme exporter protein A